MGSFGRLFGRIKKTLTPVMRKIRYFPESATKKSADFAKRTIAYAKAHPFETAAKVVLISGGIASIVVIPALGFAATGSVAGTQVAALQAAIGNVAAGSPFATMQSPVVFAIFNQSGMIVMYTAILYMGFMKWWRGEAPKEEEIEVS